MSLLQIKDPKSNIASKQRFVVGIDFGTTNSLVCNYTTIVSSIMIKMVMI